MSAAFLLLAAMTTADEQHRFSEAAIHGRGGKWQGRVVCDADATI
jgi:hypothetical protein